MTCVEPARRRVAKLAGQLGTDRIISCNVTDDADIARAAAELGQVFDGRLDIMVHSIAYARLEDLGGEFISVSREGWQLALDVSAYSLVALSRAVRPLMIASGGGSIMALTFDGGQRTVPGYNVMGVAKAALECSVRYLAYDLGPDKIRVNAISPGPIETSSSQVVDGFNNSLKNVLTHSPLLECVSPDDVGNAAVFFGSDLSRRITGTVTYVDSGCASLTPAATRHPRAAQPAE